MILTAQGIRILELLAAGKRNPAIAAELGLPLETAKSQIKRFAIEPLGARNRTHAVAIAIRSGVIS